MQPTWSRCYDVSCLDSYIFFCLYFVLMQLGEVANELVLPGTPPLGALIEFKSKHVMNICDARDD